MSAVFKREFRSFFTSPIGYVVLAVLFFFSGYFFFLGNLASQSPDLSTVFNSLFTVVLFTLPLLSMRLFSEEKRQKTDQALLTAPTGLAGIVVGKFLAALLVYALGIAITLVFAVIIALKVTPDWLVIIGNYVGILLLGGLIISIGTLISALTESQLVAALGTYAISFLLLMLDALASLFSSSTIVTSVVGFLSVQTRYYHFVNGIIGYNDVLFFVALQVLFLFLTVRVFDRRRWN
ncbi:MAG: ABC transporter permease subunit [Clostridia bacterium]|nr:ABC transporter permease subunit [Clostridia bacterium]MBQ7303045.1 ABC transporter permease subunit [Clostridia bacterium]